jgi:N-acetylneuraminic acid mutarotase
VISCECTLLANRPQKCPIKGVHFRFLSVASATASVVDGKVYAFGGDQECACSVEVYDPATDSWEKRADMPTPRARGGSALLDGRVYLIGGYPPGSDSTPIVDVYDPATDT